MYHFLNCMLLAFGPLVIAYKATALSEENGLRSCVFAAFGYAATQIVKIFVMASVLPSSADDHLNVAVAGSAATVAALANAHTWSLLEEVAKTLITLVVEVVGIQTTLQLTPALSKFSVGIRVLAVALGMAFAEAALKYALPLFWGARQAEFSWSNLEMSLAANVGFLLHLAMVAAVWMRTRTDLNKAAMPVVYTILAASAVLPSLENYLTLVLHVDSWSVLAFRALLAAVLCILAKIALSAYTSQRAQGVARKTQ